MSNNKNAGNKRDWGYASYDIDKYDDYDDTNLQYTSYEKNNSVNKYVYTNVVSVCVNAIKNSNYDYAYSIYKNSILELEEQFARPILQQRLIRSLKLR